MITVHYCRMRLRNHLGKLGKPINTGFEYQMRLYRSGPKCILKVFVASIKRFPGLYPIGLRNIRVLVKNRALNGVWSLDWISCVGLPLTMRGGCPTRDPVSRMCQCWLRESSR